MAIRRGFSLTRWRACWVYVEFVCEMMLCVIFLMLVSLYAATDDEKERERETSSERERKFWLIVLRRDTHYTVKKKLMLPCIYTQISWHIVNFLLAMCSLSLSLSLPYTTRVLFLFLDVFLMRFISISWNGCTILLAHPTYISLARLLYAP